MDESQNPYSSPQSDEEELAPQGNYPADGSRGSRSQVLRWCWAYLLNMPLPVFFGLMGTNAAGKLGMLMGIALVIAIGALVIWESRIAGHCLVRGSLVLAPTQFIALPHMFAGMIAAGVIEALGFADPLLGVPGDNLGLVGGLIATLVTGTLIAMAGAALGLLLWLVTPSTWWEKKTPSLSKP